MKTRNYLILVGVLLVNAALLYANITWKRDVSSVVGSVSDGTAYNATTTISTSASATSGYNAKIGAGVLGSVVIASSSPTFTAAGTFFKLYDGGLATSTATSTVIAKFPSTATAGTYTFDTAFNRGLIVETPPGFNGVYTVTWK